MFVPMYPFDVLVLVLITQVLFITFFATWEFVHKSQVSCIHQTHVPLSAKHSLTHSTDMLHLLVPVNIACH